MFEIYLIDKTEESINKISWLFKKLSNLKIDKTTTNLEQLKNICRIKKPVMVFIGPDYSIDDVKTVLENYYCDLEYIKIVLFVRENSVTLLKKAIELNIYDVLDFPFEGENVNQTIKRIEKFFESKTKENLVSEEKYLKVEKKEPKLIMIFSRKGGTGKSFLATNLAIDLFDKSKENVVLFDLNYFSGDISMMLNLYPKNTIFEIASIVDQLDPETIDSFLSKHTSGIKVAPSPKLPTQGERIGTEVTLKVIDLLLALNNYVVVDTGSYYSEAVISLLEKTNYFCLISSLDVPSIKNLKLSLQVLEDLRFPKDKILIIINRSDSNVGMTLNEIENTIERKIDIKIPSSRIVPITINKGIPIVKDQPRSPISRCINKLTEIIIK
ncbi:MAG: hypothetical protein M1409_03350 [Actinobacteria bacterium]|nr:hypothetical protein [Actinomycetota bacterium]